jgi:hypothetical protein
MPRLASTFGLVCLLVAFHLCAVAGSQSAHLLEDSLCSCTHLTPNDAAACPQVCLVASQASIDTMTKCVACVPASSVCPSCARYTVGPSASVLCLGPTTIMIRQLRAHITVQQCPHTCDIPKSFCVPLMVMPLLKSHHPSPFYLTSHPTGLQAPARSSSSSTQQASTYLGRCITLWPHCRASLLRPSELPGWPSHHQHTTTGPLTTINTKAAAQHPTKHRAQ